MTGIRVDMAAENAAAARDKALQDGARQALQQFVDTWVPADPRARYARMSQQQIDDMISDFSIRDESPRVSATCRSVSVRAIQASRLLRDAGVAVPLLPGEAPPPRRSSSFRCWRRASPASAVIHGAAPGGSLAERRPERFVVTRADAGVAGDQAQLTALVRQMGGESGLVVVATRR